MFAKRLGDRARRQMMRIHVPIAAGNAIASIRQRINVEEPHAGSERTLFQCRIEDSEEADKPVSLIFRQPVHLNVGGRHADDNQPMSVASGHAGNIGQVRFYRRSRDLIQRTVRRLSPRLNDSFVMPAVDLANDEVRALLERALP